MISPPESAVISFETSNQINISISKILELIEETDSNKQMPQRKKFTGEEVLAHIEEKFLVEGMDAIQFVAIYLPEGIQAEFANGPDDVESKIALQCKGSQLLRLVNTRMKEAKSEFEAEVGEVANLAAKLSNYREIVASIQEETTKINASISSTKTAVERLVLRKLTEKERIRKKLYGPSSEIYEKIQDLKIEIAAMEGNIEDLVRQRTIFLKAFGIEHEVLNVFAPNSLTGTLFCVSYDEAVGTEKQNGRKAFYLCDDKCGTRVWESPGGDIMKEAVNSSRNNESNDYAEVVNLPFSIESGGLQNVMQKFQEVKSENEMLALQARERRKELNDLQKVDALMKETIIRKKRGILKTYTGKIEYLNAQLKNILGHSKVQNLMKESIINSIRLLEEKVRNAENTHRKASKNLNAISVIAQWIRECLLQS